MSRQATVMQRISAGGVALAATLLAACGGTSSTTVTPTFQPTAAHTAAAPPAVSPTLPPTPEAGLLEVASTVQLVEVATGAVKTLVSSKTETAWDAAFEGDRVAVRIGQDTRQFRLDGTALTPAPAAPLACRQAGESAEIAGRLVANVECGASSVSPDRQWMTYPVATGTAEVQTGYSVPVWDQWLVNLQSGAASLIQAGLLHCGGCDGRYGPRWSPTSRYVVFAELGGEGRRFLTEVATAATRQIGTGSEVTYAPAWSPVNDILAYASPPGKATVLLDLGTGLARDLNLVWPAGFDASGTLLYSPAWSAGPKESGGTTTVLEVASGQVRVSLPGTPSWTRSQVWARRPTPSVLVTREGILTALQGAPSCEGTAIYQGSTLRQCIADGVDAAIGPGGIVAVMRRVGLTGRAHGPGFETVSLDRYEIDLVESGGRRTVLRDVLSFGPPPMEWHSTGMYLLVRWPFSGGL